MIGGASVIVSTLLVSFAYSQNIGIVNSPATKPDIGIQDSKHFTFAFFAKYQDNHWQDLKYQFGTFTVTTTVDNQDITIKDGYILSNQPFSAHLLQYDALTGNLTYDLPQYQSINGQNQGFSYYIAPQIAQINASGGLYYDIPVASYIYLTGGPYSNEFIVFSQKPPEHNIYHSHLSEPVADKYNRYFILDDKLYWVSLRVNGAYVLVNDVLTESEVESYTSTGEYVGAVQTGTGNSSLIALGSQITYKDLEVYPVKLKSEQYFDNDLLYLSIYYTNNGSDLRLNLDKLALIKALSVDRLYIETELYYSVFNLESGEYVESFYQDYDGYVSSNVSLNANLPAEISDIKCYGISFLNVDNKPVNLSDIYWQYDMEFVEWRDRMEIMLEKIYQALSGETVETETYTQPSWNEDLSQAEPHTRISQEEIQSVFDDGFDDVKPSPEDQLYITSWVDMFSVPKLIAACCFALAMGTIILTLGKKKSD